jgi:hypothetical protein
VPGQGKHSTVRNSAPTTKSQMEGTLSVNPRLVSTPT